ncbi:MAG: glucokinase [Gammaproteobacteria bacterium]
MQVLSGDIGGTKTRLAVVEQRPDGPVLLRDLVFDSPQYASLEDVLAAFFNRQDLRPEFAGLGVAGPVAGDRCTTTNLPWRVDAGQIREAFGLSGVFLLNDLEAVGWGIPALEGDDFCVLNRGESRPGNGAVIAAGTGLGEAGLYWDGHRHVPFACEGGHTDFAPAGELETGLYQWLHGQFGHVSWERLISGPGLVNIYRFLLQKRQARIPGWLEEQAREGGMAAAVSTAALCERDELCVEALDLFVSLYGREAGNLALKLLATGGVHLAGGIAPKLLERLKQPDFMRAFSAKGRMTALLQAMPVQVVLDDRVALLGAACYALERFDE